MIQSFRLNVKSNVKTKFKKITIAAMLANVADINALYRSYFESSLANPSLKLCEFRSTTDYFEIYIFATQFKPMELYLNQRTITIGE